MNGRLSISLLRVVLGVALAFYGAQLMIHQLHGRMHLPLLGLGFAELVAAIVFLLPRTSRCGGIALLVVFVCAAAVHILHGEFDVGYLAIYGAAVLAVITNER
jgi:hypothetical protein